MNRRTFLCGLTLGTLSAPLGVEAQQVRKTSRIGVLALGIPTMYTARYEAFRQGLRELGYVEGQTIAIEYRYAEGKFERLPDLAAELVRLNVDIILASSAPETRAAKRATTSIPIVFGLHGDPVGTGDVASLGKPGGNITGMATMAPDLSGKRLELLKEAFPRIARVAMLWNTTNPAKAGDWRETQGAAQALGLTLQSREVRGPEDFPSAFAAMTTQRPDAFLTLDDPVLLNSRSSIVAFAAKQRLPVIYPQRDYTDAGGLMSYGPSVSDMFRHAASYVGRILKGAKPADLPVEQPTKFELVINLKTAKALGLTIPPSVLGRADQIIE
jgi:putative tryptophan/tyrosine transport system substrate-binding protein